MFDWHQIVFNITEISYARGGRGSWEWLRTQSCLPRAHWARAISRLRVSGALRPKLRTRVRALAGSVMTELMRVLDRRIMRPAPPAIARRRSRPAGWCAAGAAQAFRAQRPADGRRDGSAIQRRVGEAGSCVSSPSVRRK